MNDPRAEHGHAVVYKAYHVSIGGDLLADCLSYYTKVLRELRGPNDDQIPLVSPMTDMYSSFSIPLGNMIHTVLSFTRVERNRKSGTQEEMEKTEPVTIPYITHIGIVSAEVFQVAPYNDRRSSSNVRKSGFRAEQSSVQLPMAADISPEMGGVYQSGESDSSSDNNGDSGSSSSSSDEEPPAKTRAHHINQTPARQYEQGMSNRHSTNTSGTPFRLSGRPSSYSDILTELGYTADEVCRMRRSQNTYTPANVFGPVISDT
jgi:hypothetical protein